MSGREEWTWEAKHGEITSLAAIPQLETAPILAVADYDYKFIKSGRRRSTAALNFEASSAQAYKYYGGCR